MTKNIEKRVKKRIRFPYFIFYFIILLASFYMIYSISLLAGVENKVRMLLSVNIIIILLLCFFYNCRMLVHGQKRHYIYMLFCILYPCILTVGANYIHKTYTIISEISTDSTTYYSSLITKKENNIEKLSELKTGSIGYLKDSTSIEGNQMPKEILKTEKLENKTIEYENYSDLLNALLEDKIMYAFVPRNYTLLFANLDSGVYSELEEKTKVIYTKERKVKNENTSAGTTIEQPFTILIMGVDSENENLEGSTFNGDALMLLTFNPTTLNTTILSIPRDSYVPIACLSGKRQSKITHAAFYGADCMMQTISDFLDIKIDYYVKINFKGVVKLIDQLGGVEVDVPYSFCEQDSNRRFGNNTIYVKKGLQTLNGEQALALSRNRKSNASRCSKEWTEGLRNDFVRGQNQQLVLRATLNKLKEVNSLDTLYSLLNSISNSMETNMKTSEMLSLYNIGKALLVKANGQALEDLVGFQRLYLNGHDDYMYDSGAKMELYEYVLEPNSVSVVSSAMKVNLELKEPMMEKEFVFDEAEEYEESVIGKYVTGNSSTLKIPNVVGLTEKSATTKLKNVGVDVVVRYISEESGVSGNVLKQSVAAGVEASNVQEVILTVLKK